MTDNKLKPTQAMEPQASPPKASIPDAVADFVENYHFEFSSGSTYTPTASERAMLDDALRGFLDQSVLGWLTCNSVFKGAAIRHCDKFGLIYDDNGDEVDWLVVMRFTAASLAKAIEAQSDKSGTGLAVGDSADPKGFAQGDQP